MKKISKATLAILLAALMLLSLGTAAGAAEPLTAVPAEKLARSTAEPVTLTLQDEASTVGTITIVNLGTAKATVYKEYYDEDYYYSWAEQDISGLVVKASGGLLEADETVAYDDTSAEDYLDQISTDEIYWRVSVGLDWEAQYNWQVGNNKAILSVIGWKYTDFIKLREVDGEEYGYFESEEVFYGAVSINITGVEGNGIDGIDKDSAIPLTLGQAEKISIPDPSVSGRQEQAILSFTPAEDGVYYFQSKGASHGETLYNKDGERVELPYLDPWANLFDANGAYLIGNDDDYYGNQDGHSYDFGITYLLEKGKTYYLLTSCYGYGDYSVTVNKSTGTLKTSGDSITVNFHELFDLSEALEGTTWNLGQLRFQYDSSIVRFHSYERMYGAARGSTTITVIAPDNKTAEIKVTVKYTLQQWLCAIFLGGWYWLKYTGYGEFSLIESLKELFSWGVANGIRNVLDTISYDIYRAFQDLLWRY